MSPLAKKLLIKPGSEWLFLNAPTEAIEVAHPLPENATISIQTKGNFDGILLFVKSKAELLTALEIIVPLLTPATIFWISYPKKSSKIQSDLKMGDWEELGKLNLNGVASIAVNETWAASRFRPMGQSKISGIGNEEIKKNECAYIDVDKKQITLPSEITNLLEQHPDAMNTYQSLSYSNRKEYVLWILTAKQEKTKTERLAKMVEKLVKGKKNPSDK